MVDKPSHWNWKAGVCWECFGEGIVWDETCPTCGGTGRMEQTAEPPLIAKTTKPLTVPDEE